MSPRATYRVQFHAGFTFADALPLVDYWADLGVSHLYASPIATARQGSTHGYDVVDPTTVNPHLGGHDVFVRLVEALRARGLGVILDIVPNHVAVGGRENSWWLDLLENGPASRYARYFDVDWTPIDPTLHGKILAPFLGAPYAEVLASGELRLEAEQGEDRLSLVAYGAHRFPLRREDYPGLLEELGAKDVGHVSPTALTRFDGTQEDGRARLHALLEKQHWRLAWWRSAGDAINWRRFFDITELAGLRIEEPEVFEAVHALPLRLYADGLIDGVRVDHVDGLADPAGYCRQLRAALQARMAERPEALRKPAYLVVEKILGPGEALSADWGIDGTTGYEFMDAVSAVLHAPEAGEPLAAFWHDLSGRPAEFNAEVRPARAEILQAGFGGQLDAVAWALHRAGQSVLATRDYALPAYRRAATALIEAFGVYRTYATAAGAPASDAHLLAQAVQRATETAPNDEAVVRLVGQWLSGRGDAEPALLAEALRRFQQLSSPIAAKAVEDTAFYRYGRLLSRNDVGFDPARFSRRPEDFLALCRERGERFPEALLTTATHDHKRGEDIRARLATLSEMADAWTTSAKRWVKSADDHYVEPADAYMALQMIVGAWPLDLTTSDLPGLQDFAERLVAWQTKALREAKLRSSWTRPDEAYEQRCADYVTDLLTRGAWPLEEIAIFAEALAAPGAAKGLVQTGLRLTLPGVPDLFQGCEFWDLSLVDPDNRRPVSYERRRAALATPDTNWRCGRIKQRLIAELLAMRQEDPELFTRGELVALRVEGLRAGDIMAFERRFQGRSLLVTAVLRTSEACRTRPAIDAGWWADTAVLASDGPLAAAEIAGSRPFAASILKT